jgi:hypothetical protein
MTNIRPFHLAFPVYNIKETIGWYTTILGCQIGRQEKRWVDFNFFGHQISAHQVDKELLSDHTNIVDGHNIPSRHFGAVLTIDQWEHLNKHFTKNKIQFLIKPTIRFKGEIGEQATMFIRDPSGNVLEFKAFQNDNMIFKK